MPSKADFQALADWCSQPPLEHAYLTRVAQATMTRMPAASDEQVELVGDGHLTFIPAGLSRWMPEHFAGAVQHVSAHYSSFITIAVAVGNTWAVMDLGGSWGWGEYDITAVNQYGDGLVGLLFHRDMSWGQIPYLLFLSPGFAFLG